MATELDTLRARLDALEDLCGYLYQFAGEVGAPVPILAALWAATDRKKPIRPSEDLPRVLATDCTEVADRDRLLTEVRALLGVSAAAELGRVGGSKTSKAKQLAARANGKKGGRPRKVA